MSAPIKVLALTPIPEEGAGCRFRVSQYVPYLRSAGFDVTISPFYTPEFFRLVYQRGHYARKALSFSTLALRRVRELFTFDHYDLVLLYREAIPLGPPLIEWLVARARPAHRLRLRRCDLPAECQRSESRVRVPEESRPRRPDHQA